MVQKDKFLSSSYPSVIDVSIVILGVVLLFGCSQIAIPIQPVPITLQTMGVIFIILTYNTNQAVQTILAYILLGALGIPLYSGYRGGLTVVIGPTGGYILGFLLGTLVALPFKKLFDSYSSILKAFVLSTIITLVIMISGVLWLSVQVGIPKAVEVGFIPFIIPGIVKSGILSLVLRGIGYFKRG